MWQLMIVKYLGKKILIEVLNRRVKKSSIEMGTDKQGKSEQAYAEAMGW